MVTRLDYLTQECYRAQRKLCDTGIGNRGETHTRLQRIVQKYTKLDTQVHEACDAHVQEHAQVLDIQAQRALEEKAQRSTQDKAMHTHSEINAKNGEVISISALKSDRGHVYTRPRCL